VPSAGASVLFRPVAGLTRERLQRIIPATAAEVLARAERLVQATKQRELRSARDRARMMAGG
jgi:hypothetical protein